MADGCTGIPKWLGNLLGIEGCCDEHDHIYGTPGTWVDKVKGDLSLSRCILCKGFRHAAKAAFLLTSTVGWFYWRKAQKGARERQPVGDVTRIPPEARARNTHED